MSVHSKMTAIADEIRELSGTTGTMGLDAMAEHVSDANDAVDSQENLIAQISAALEGKAGGGGASVETCTVTVTNEVDAGKMYCTILTNGVCEAQLVSLPSNRTVTVDNVVSGSSASIIRSSVSGMETTGDITVVDEYFIDGYIPCNFISFGSGQISIRLWNVGA